MREVGMAIYVDAFYCPPGMGPCQNSTGGGVLMELINLSDLNGTITSDVAGMFRCDPIRKCGISLYDIKLKSSSKEDIRFECLNANGYSDHVHPPSCLGKP